SELNEYEFWTKGKDRCDPDLARLPHSIEYKEGGIAFMKIANESKEYTCPIGNIFVNVGPNKRPLIGTKVECKKKWEITLNDGDPPQVINEEFDVICGAPFCTQCTDSTLSPFKCPSCTPPMVAPSRRDDCVTPKCTSHLRILDGKWYEKPTFECVKADSGNYAWKHKEEGVI
ncbi:hypothetical protein PMAYCL1PPCAC_18849, partial [Pristionchus mayeri]